MLALPTIAASFKRAQARQEKDERRGAQMSSSMCLSFFSIMRGNSRGSEARSRLRQSRLIPVIKMWSQKTAIR